MKKIILLLLVLCSLQQGHAQLKSAATWGVKAGLNFYNLYGNFDEEIKRSFRPAPLAGMFVRIPIGTVLSLQPELLYSSEGCKMESLGEKAAVRMNYLNLPLMVQLRSSSGFMAETGPQVGYLLRGKIAYEDDGDSETEDVTSTFNDFALSWGLGIGYQVSRLGVGLRYNYGLTGLVREEMLEDGDDKTTSRGFALSLSYSLGR